MAALLLPLNGAVVSVPGEASLDDLLRLLCDGGGAPTRAWLAAAHHLLAAGRERDCEALLGEAVERGDPQQPQDVFPHVQALCSLAEFTAQQAAGEKDRRQRAEALMRAADLCYRAQRLSFEEQLPCLVLAHVALVKVRWACWGCSACCWGLMLAQPAGREPSPMLRGAGNGCLPQQRLSPAGTALPSPPRRATPRGRARSAKRPCA